MEKVVLQNLILKNDVDKNLQDYFEFMHRSNSIVYNAKEKSHIIKANEHIDFSTYFNCLQIKYWKKHTNVKAFGFELEYSGEATLEIIAVANTAKNIDRELLAQTSLSSPTKTKIQIDIPETDKVLLYFSLETHSEFSIYSGNYYGYIEKENVRDVRISIATTTFKKENFITKNVGILKKKVLCEESPIRDRVFVHVIDNGRTLNPTKIDGYHVKVYPNANVGGAGGYTRGIIEAIQSEFNPTHVLLMDDDVLQIGESLFRTYYLLRVVKEEYAERFVSGAMFDYDIRETRYEDIGFVHQDNASYGPVKAPTDMRWLDNILANEKIDYTEKSDTYAGWWYCCIPVSVIKKHGLPLPVFIRGDDVEFSLRNKTGFLTLNGICIWHVGFAGKFNAAMELYQVHRNSFIIQAISGICDDIKFLPRIKELFWKELTRLAYSNAEQLLDAVDDFLKGPEFLKNLNGEACLKEHAAKNEKMVPLNTLPADWIPLTWKNIYEHRGIRKFEKFIYMATINGHLLPKFMLRRKVGVVSYDWFFSPADHYKRKIVVAINPNDNTVVVRKMDKKRAFALIKRYRKLMRQYKKNIDSVTKAYRESFDELVSFDFWKQYLNTNLEATYEKV